MVIMKVDSILGAAIFVLLTNKVDGYGSGAPSSQCGSLTPGHDVTPLDNSNSPYTINVAKTSISSGEALDVEIKTSGQGFLGYMLQVRDDADNVVGSFASLGAQGQFIKCTNEKDTLTHSSPVSKTSVLVTWTAPSQWTGSIKVLGTVVQSYNSYYVKLQSSQVNVLQGDASAEPEAEPEAEAEPEPEGEPEAEAVKSEAFNGCGQEKSCFGSPEGCEETGNCDYMFSWKMEGEKVLWEGFRKGTGFVGVGVSDDDKMGNDFIFICSESGVKEYSSSGRNAPASIVSTSSLNLLESNVDNGNMYCKFESGAQLSSDSVDLVAALKDSEYHILVARGSGQLSYHAEDRTFTADPLALSRVSRVGAGSNLLLKLHGLFMLIAWIGFAGKGIIFARYFKQTWKGKPVMGADRWFQAHRFLMVAAVIFTIIGFVLVLVYTKGWHYDMDFIRNNPHPVIGLVTIILALIQPIMALMRPHPGTKYRPVFNWVHWFVGNAAYNLGVAAIFLAGNLSAISIPKTGYVVCLVIYIVVYVATHLLLAFHGVKMQNKESEAEIHPMSNTSEKGVSSGVVEATDQPGGRFRKTVLGIFVLFNEVLVIAIIVLIFYNK